MTTRRGWDCAVIGGGIAGSSAAYHLAREGVEVVHVCGDQAGDATSAGAGGIQPALDLSMPEAWYPLAFSSARHIPELVAQLAEDGESDTGYGTVGSLLLGTTPGEIADLRSAALVMESSWELGAPNVGRIEWLDATECRELCPLVADGVEGIYAPDAARIDGHRFRTALQRAAVRRGGKIRQGTCALSRSRRAWRLRVGQDEFAADRVVAAPGVWAQDLLSPLGIQLPVFPQRGQIIHVTDLDRGQRVAPIVSSPGKGYMVPFDEGRWAVGTTRENNVGFDYCPTPGGIASILRQVAQYAPGIMAGRFEEARAGIRPVCVDGLPIIGEVGDFPGMSVVTGLGSSGLTLGPYAGMRAAEIALGNKPYTDISAFGAGRFG